MALAADDISSARQASARQHEATQVNVTALQRDFALSQAEVASLRAQLAQQARNSTAAVVKLQGQLQDVQGKHGHTYTR